MIFPFIAFFVVFSNVVITADLTDLRLLRDVADGFSVVSTDSPTICRIENFCKRLVKLCFEAITRPWKIGNDVFAPALAPQANADRSFLQSEEGQAQDTSRTQVTQRVAGTQRPNAFNPPAPSQLDIQVASHCQPLMPNVGALGMLEGQIDPMACGVGDEQIRQLLESQFDDFSNLLEV